VSGQQHAPAALYPPRKNRHPSYRRLCPEGSRKLRFPDYVKMAQDGGKVFSLTHLPPLPPGTTPGAQLC